MWNTNTTTFGQKISNEGTKLGGELQLSNTGSYSWGPEGTNLDNGDFILLWRGRDSDSFGVVGRVFDQDGNSKTEEFIVNTNEARNQFHASATQLENGNIAVAWMDSSDGDESSLSSS